MSSLRKTFLATTLAALVGWTASANAQFPQGNQDPRRGPVVLPQFKGNQFPTRPTLPTVPVQNRIDYREVHRLAERLEREASRLHDGVDDRSRRTNTYRVLHNEVETLEALADRIHTLADRRVNPTIIHQEVVRVESSVRRIDRLIDELARTQQVDRSTISQLRRRLESVNRVAEDLHREVH